MFWGGEVAQWLRPFAALPKKYRKTKVFASI